MDGRSRTFLLLQVFLCFFAFASTEETKQNCSQVQCPGPLIYYHNMGCTPVYRNQGDCCAYKYNCDHLNAISPNKCYIKRSSYEIGEYVNSEDINSCHLKCMCISIMNSPQFRCSYVLYEFRFYTDPSCYVKSNINDCGPGTLICSKNQSEIPQCIMDGRTYKGGETFLPINDPYKVCMCQESHTGDNFEPFCKTMSFRCDPELYYNEDIANKHAPIYSKQRNLASQCMFGWRRQMANDTVIPNPNKSTSSGENHSVDNEDLTCKFGNLTMNIGDQLSPYTDSLLSRVNCTCEVPPTLSCKTSVGRM